MTSSGIEAQFALQKSAQMCRQHAGLTGGEDKAQVEAWQRGQTFGLAHRVQSRWQAGFDEADHGHGKDWLDLFRREVAAISNVIDFFRIAGDYDYMLKVVARDMNDFDRIYQRLIEKVELDTVTSCITIEAILNGRDLPV